MSVYDEVIAAPGQVYLAPTGEVATDLNDAVAGNWVLLGTNGNCNYDEDGIVIAPEQTIEKWRSLGKTGPQKSWRTEEELMIRLGLVDVTAEEYAKVINSATVTDTAPGSGTAGTRSFPLIRGQQVTLLSMLVRFDESPYDDAFKMQWWIPLVYQSEDQEITFTKGDPGMLDTEWTAIQDTADGFGEFQAQDEAAT